MALIVQKYGGSSVANTGSLELVARRIENEYRQGNKMVVVVSAMGDTTDHLVEMASSLNPHPPEREMDMLLSVGERISIALLAIRLNHLGIPAISFTGSQVGIITDTRHTEARILEIRAGRIHEELQKGRVVVVAGFQGVSIDKEITTLGRGGSDTTAVALAAALKADRCEIMKDVEGIFVAEPRLIPNPKLNPQLSYDEMIEMANMGARVLKTESVEIARRYRIKLAIGSTEKRKTGTIITDHSLDSSEIKGIVGQKNMARVKISAPSIELLRDISLKFAEQRIKSQIFILHHGRLEMVVQNRLLPLIEKILNIFKAHENTPQYEIQKQYGTIGIVGSGFNFNSEKAERILHALNHLKIIPQLLQISEIKISWAMPESETDATVQRLYTELQV